MLVSPTECLADGEYLNINGSYSYNCMLKLLTSNPRLVRSCSTAQVASMSRPFMFMDPNLIEVGVLGGGPGVAESLAWSDFLSCFVIFCLCFWGL